MKWLWEIQNKMDDRKAQRLRREAERKRKIFEAQKELWDVEREINSLKPVGEAIKNTGKGFVSGLASFGEYSQKVSNNLSSNLFGYKDEEKKKEK